MPGLTVAGVAWTLWTLAVATVVRGIMSRQQTISARRASKNEILSNGHQITKRSHQEPLPLIYGRSRVAVNQVFIASTGGSNRYLHMVCVLGEGEIHGILRDDNTTYTTTATEMPESDPVPLIYLDEVLWTEFPAKSRYAEFYNGSATQAVCATLHAAVPQWNDALRNTAYIYLRLEYDRTKYMSDPGSIMVVVDGLKIYNPLTESTYFNNNNALVAYDYLTRSAQRGGLGFPASAINEESLSDFKEYVTDRGWFCNFPIVDNVAAADNLKTILGAARGDVIDDGAGGIKFVFADLNYESVAMALTDADILTDKDGMEQISVAPADDVLDVPNAIRAKWLNGNERKFVIDDFVHVDDDAVTDDGGDVREQTVDLRPLTSLEKVQAMAYYTLERARFNKQVTGTFGPRTMALEVNDIVTLTVTRFGWDQKYFRVNGIAHLPNFCTQLSLLEEDEDLYDDLYDPAALDWFDTTLLSPNSDPLPVRNVTIAEEVYVERQRSRSRLIVDFEAPPDYEDPFWDHAEVWVKRGTLGAWRFATTAGENDSATGYVIDPAEERVWYFVKLISVSIHGRKEPFATAYTVSHLVRGMNSQPDDLSALTAISNAGSVTLSANYTGTADIVSYEIRVGTTWEDGIVVATAPANNSNLRISFNGVRPGTFTFWASPINNAGRYCENPISATVTVFLPAGYTQLATYGAWVWDSPDGTHSNTEWTTHIFSGTSYDALKCSHTEE